MCGDYYIGGRRFSSLSDLIGYYSYVSCLLKEEKLLSPVAPPEVRSGCSTPKCTPQADRLTQAQVSLCGFRFLACRPPSPDKFPPEVDGETERKN